MAFACHRHSLVCLPLVLVFTLSHVALAANILFVPLIGEGSHFDSLNTIATEMVNRGHNITILVRSYYKEHLSSLHGMNRYHFESFTPLISQETVRKFLMNMTSAGLKVKYTKWFRKNIGSDHEKLKLLECRSIFDNKDLMSRLRNTNFNLAIQDRNYLCPIVQYLRKHMGIPYIAISLIITMPSSACLANRWPFNPSYMPEALTAFDHVMSFQERLINTGWTLLITYLANKYVDFYKRLRHDFNITDTTIFYEDAELFLINSHFLLDYPKPTLPNTVMVGGLTTGPRKLLDTVSSLKPFEHRLSITINLFN